MRSSLENGKPVEGGGGLVAWVVWYFWNSLRRRTWEVAGNILTQSLLWNPVVYMLREMLPVL